MDFPYSFDKNARVPQKNIAQMIGVAEWILNGQHTGKRHQLGVAFQLNNILRRNEVMESTRDDARAFAEGMQVLINNTFQGRVDERQLIEDMKFFMIDQGRNLIGIPAQALHGIGPSNAAANLFGDDRIGTIDWKEDYWDNGKQYSKDNLINQAHHFSAFFIAGLSNKTLATFEAGVLDGSVSINIQDLELSNMAIDLAAKIRNEEITWQQLPIHVYHRTKK